MARETGRRGSLLGRRSYLQLAGTAAVTVAATSGTTGTATDDETPPTDRGTSATDDATADGDSLTDLHGAIYWPASAFNHYQVWADYDSAEIDRDFGYAADLNLDALRVVVGWEFWRDSPEAFRRAFDDLLALADRHSLRILPVFFEPIGAEPTRENFVDDSVLTSFAVKSPSVAVVRDEARWDGPRRFVEWFAGRYGGHDAVVALEIMNEPGEWTPRVEFCREMLRAARSENSDVPLTMGCKDFRFNRLYDDPALDVHQFHFNLPPTEADMERKLREAEAFANETGTPIWLTEWQRARSPQPPNKMLPNYESLAETIYESDVGGDFFWQLMLKPAYIDTPRKMGRLNGLVHEDGSVYSAQDARAISGEDSGWTERREWPQWAESAERRWAPCSQSSPPKTCSQE